LAVRACARVGANRKTAQQKKRPVKEFKPTSADYDARIFAFREKDWSVSLTLVGGREHIPIVTSNYQIGKLKGSKPTSAQLCKHKDGSYYLHIQLKDEDNSFAPVTRLINQNNWFRQTVNFDRRVHKSHLRYWSTAWLCR